MGVFSKLAFWKRDSDFAKMDKDPFGGGKDPFAGIGAPGGMPGTPGADMSMPGAGADPFAPAGFPQQPAFSPSSFSQQQSFAAQPAQQSYAYVPPQSGSDLQVISAKLDAIRATLDSLNQRVANIERLAYGEQEQQQKGRYQW